MAEEQQSADAVEAAMVAQWRRLAERPLASGLHLVSTPIGNLGDISLRALATLANATAIYCEDTRHSRTLLTHFGIAAKLRAYHEHNADHERPLILARLAAGEIVALISDAGTPLISDPGFKLVRDAISGGHAVYAVPGACAAIAAISVAGLPSDCFLFAGFLPPRAGQRRNRLGELAMVQASLILYEAPQRVAETLGDIAAVLGDRPCAIARELTKLHEHVRRGTALELQAEIAGTDLRGEVVIVIAPPGPRAASDADIVRALQEELGHATTRDAVRTVAERLGAARSRVYDLATALKREEPE